MDNYFGYDVLREKWYKLALKSGQYVTDESSDKGVQYLFLPPLIDIQVNGYDGVDFNDEQLKVSDVVSASESLREAGVGFYFPTIITNSPDTIQFLLSIIALAVKEYDICREMIRGIHIEGPFISNDDGPRGAHPLKYVCAPDKAMIDDWKAASNGLFCLLTLSPEWKNTSVFIKYCVTHDIKVAIGHTNADESQIRKAVSAGSVLSTHLGNGISLNLPRHPNSIWSQLGEDDLYASIIADGHHLPMNVLKVFQKVKQEKLIMISDSTKFAGAEPGEYDTFVGGKVVLDGNRRLYLKNQPRLLAGSASSLLDCLNYTLKNYIFDLRFGVECCTTHPAELFSDRFDMFDDYRMVCKQKNGAIKLVEPMIKLS